MNYTVKYRKTGSMFFKFLKSVKGDGFVDNKNIRFFILDDDSRIEISTDNMEFVFCRNRFLNIKKSMEAEIGQPLQLNS